MNNENSWTDEPTGDSKEGETLDDIFYSYMPYPPPSTADYVDIPRTVWLKSRGIGKTKAFALYKKDKCMVLKIKRWVEARRDEAHHEEYKDAFQQVLDRIEDIEKEYSPDAYL